jgi:hypothetical protein
MTMRGQNTIGWRCRDAVGVGLLCAVVLLAATQRASAASVRVPRDSTVIIHHQVHQPNMAATSAPVSSTPMQPMRTTPPPTPEFFPDPGYRPIWIPGTHRWNGFGSTWVPGHWVWQAP